MSERPDVPEPIEPETTVLPSAATGAEPAVATPPFDPAAATEADTTTALASPVSLALIDDGEQPVDPAATGSVPTVPRDPARRLVLVALLLAIVGIGLSLISVNRATRFSALDEATHIDYAWTMAHFGLPSSGAPLSEYTLNSWACRGQANIKALPPCDGNAPYTSFPGGGQQYNAFHPPLYYAVTGLAARAIAAITGQDFITVARSLGAIWLFAAMFGLYLTLRYWRVPWLFALLGGLALPLIPTVLHASSTVTNDAPSALCGVAAVFVLGRVLIYRRTGWVLPTVFALLAASTKILNAVGLLVVAGLLVLLALIHWRRRGFRVVLPWLRIGLAMIVAVGVVYVVWDKINQHRTVPGWVNPVANVNQATYTGLPLGEWLPSLVSGFRLGSNYYLDPVVNSNYVTAWAVVATLLMGSACFIGLALFRRGTPRWLLSLALFLGCLAYPLVVQIQVALGGNHGYFPVVSTRYGLSLIPIAIALLAIIAGAKRLRITAGATVGVGLLVVLATTAGWT